MVKKTPLILLSNDDGYFAEGLRVLRETVAPLGEVVSVTPDQDCSGTSHKLTLNMPLRLREVGEGAFTANGSPVDCIHLAVHGVLQGRLPDLVISGINHGLNLGEDTAYSGTVSAAYEGFVMGIPAIAVSSGPGQNGFAFEYAANLVGKLAKALLDDQKPLKQAVWNLNVPSKQPKGLRLCRLDRRSFQSSLDQRRDPRGRTYYWHGPYYPEFTQGEDCDYTWYKSGFATLTPLKVEMTDFDVLKASDTLPLDTFL